MFSTTTTYDRSREGNQVDVRGRPMYSRDVRYGCYGMAGRSPEPLYLVSCMLAEVKVCRADANWVENIFGFHLFNEWWQRCGVVEFHGYSINDLDVLINDITNSLGQTNEWVGPKIQGIHFSTDLLFKLKDFSILDNSNKGAINFGLLSIIRCGDVVNAACCVFTMKFVVAPERILATTKTYIFGFEVNASTTDWTEDKSLGFIPKQSLLNFGWLKALEEFKRQGVLSNINDVLYLPVEN